jgi:hypothetical protein
MAQAAADGKFTLTGLTPGEYELRANIMPNNDSATAQVSVSGGDVTGVQMTVAKPSTVRGRLVFLPSANDSQPPRATSFDLGAVRVSDSTPFGQRMPARINADGSFEISAPGGRTLLRGAFSGQQTGPAAPPPWRINRVMYGDIDVADTGLELQPASTVENVVIELTNRASEVTGTVTDAEGAVVRDCWVIAFAQDPIHWTVQTRHVSAGRPGLDDLYRMRLLPGDYFIVAFDDVENGAWNDPNYLSLAREHATKISVADGENPTINLKVSPTPVY